MSINESWPFRSPLSKLLRFFRRSRDQWKAKCKAAKRENKSLKYRLAKMKESRDRWKAEVRSLRANMQDAKAPAEVETKNRGESGSRGRRRRPARLGVAGAR
jgi:chromosome segregation ATPase